MALPYPTEWESDVVLADGGTMGLRPIRPDDDQRLLDLYNRLSDESLYLRFFSPVPRPTAHQLERLTHIDYDTRMALGALLDDQIIGIARFDRAPGADEAEVAFVVDDAHQGRGIATVMLEHLAAIARQRGIDRFTASTLPDNRRMLGVFRHAGFEVARRFEDGVVTIEFPIEPTDRSIAAVEERERIAEAQSTARLLAPRSIAVVGASRRAGTIGHEVFRNLLASEFEGPVYPVNPGAHHVAGVRAYPTVLEVPDEVDLCVVTVPAPAVLEVVEQAARKGVFGLVVISAGFAETGPEGREREEALVRAVRRYGLRLVGPNCMGVVNTNPAVRMNATFAPYEPVPGRVAFLSQSGGLGIELLGRANRLGLGVSSFISVGNKADVSGNDLLQHWETDDDTDVILLYLESFGNPRKFARLARRISRTKPIVAVKSGRTAAGSRAASSHTAALATADVAVDALFRQAGVVRVDTLAQLFDTAQVLVHQPPPPGRRVAIVGNSGGPGIIAADACEGAGLTVPELSDATQAQLRTFVAEAGAVRNPVDLVASGSSEAYEHAVRTVLRDPGVDAVLAIFVPPLVTQADDVARAIAAAAADAGPKPVVACFLGAEGVPEALRGTDGHRAIPAFAFPEAAAQALARAADLEAWRHRPAGAVPELEGCDLAAAHAIVDRVLAATDAPTWLPPADAADLLRAVGVPVVETRRATSLEEAIEIAGEIGYPVALKAGSGDVVHKTDVGGVALDLLDPGEIKDAYAAMEAALGGDLGEVVLQPMVPAGIETIVGVTQDPSFGPLVLFGMGGTSAELLGDHTLRILPLTDVDAAEMVRSLRTSPLLFGYRGARPSDTAALEDVLLRVGHLAEEIPEITELDCNPVIVTAEGAWAVDVKVHVAPVRNPYDEHLRRR